MREILSGAAIVGAIPQRTRIWPSSICARSVTKARRILRRGLPRAARAEWSPYSQKLLAEAGAGLSFRLSRIGPVLRFFVATLGCSICRWGAGTQPQAVCGNLLSTLY